MTKALLLPSAEELRQYFTYSNGLLFYQNTFGSRYKVGDIACKEYTGKNGYKCVSYGGKTYKSHRVIWKIVTGEDPNGFVDHINRDKTDNRFENLRVVDKSVNALNNKANGSSYQKDKKKYRAVIKINGKQIFLGLFDTAEEASSRYQEFKELYMEMVNA